MQTAETREWYETHNMYIYDDITTVSECYTLSTMNCYYSTHFFSTMYFWLRLFSLILVCKQRNLELFVLSSDCPSVGSNNSRKAERMGILINISAYYVQIKIVQRYFTLHVEPYMRIRAHLHRYLANARRWGKCAEQMLQRKIKDSSLSSTRFM
jgi:hypothetical protein